MDDREYLGNVNIYICTLKQIHSNNSNILCYFSWLFVGMQSIIWRTEFRKEPFSKCLGSGLISLCSHW